MCCIVPNKPPSLCCQSETTNNKPFKIKIMKTQTTNFFEPLGKAAIDCLVKEIKETVANGIDQTATKTILSAADLWNIQRMKRARVQRRFLV